MTTILLRLETQPRGPRETQCFLRPCLRIAEAWARTSDQGMARTWPESNSVRRCATSACQADSQSTSRLSSRLSSREPARSARSSSVSARTLFRRSNERSVIAGLYPLCGFPSTILGLSQERFKSGLKGAGESGAGAVFHGSSDCRAHAFRGMLFGERSQDVSDQRGVSFRRFQRGDSRQSLFDGIAFGHATILSEMANAGDCAAGRTAREECVRFALRVLQMRCRR
jgi:hypothetical protein